MRFNKHKKIADKAHALREVMCEGKTPYAGKQSAAKVLRRMQAHKVDNCDKIRPYFCGFCGKYHLGSYV